MNTNVSMAMGEYYQLRLSGRAHEESLFKVSEFLTGEEFRELKRLIRC